MCNVPAATITHTAAAIATTRGCQEGRDLTEINCYLHTLSHGHPLAAGVSEWSGRSAGRAEVVY